MTTAPKRILHMHFGRDGGQERFFVNLAKAIAERGVEQKFIIRPERSWKSHLTPLGEVIENHNRRMTLSGQMLRFKIRGLLRDYRPEVVMAWGKRAARVLPSDPTPLRVTRLGDFPTHLKHFGNVDVAVGNTPDYERAFHDLGWTKPVVTISNFPREVMPVAVNRADLDTPEDAFLISGAGRFAHRKGFDCLIKAAARVPGAWLWLIGDGGEREALEALVDECGIRDCTRFVGWVDEPMHYVAASDVFAMPSRHEPLGNVVFEAWHAGIPTVSFRAEGPVWFATDDHDALLVDIDDVDGLTAAIERIRTEDGLGARLVENAHATLAANFTKDRIVDQYFDLFARKGL